MSIEHLSQSERGIVVIGIVATVILPILVLAATVFLVYGWEALGYVGVVALLVGAALCNVAEDKRSRG